MSVLFDRRLWDRSHSGSSPLAYTGIAALLAQETEGISAGTIVGFILATQCAGEMTHDSLYEHSDTGETLCVHSVCVDPRLRRRGLALDMLRHYMRTVGQALADQGVIRCAALMSRPHLTALYAGAGFVDKGPSPIVHGADPWVDMRVEYR